MYPYGLIASIGAMVLTADGGHPTVVNDVEVVRDFKHLCFDGEVRFDRKAVTRVSRVYLPTYVQDLVGRTYHRMTVYWDGARPTTWFAIATNDHPRKGQAKQRCLVMTTRLTSHDIWKKLVDQSSVSTLPDKRGAYSMVRRSDGWLLEVWDFTYDDARQKTHYDFGVAAVDILTPEQKLLTPAEAVSFSPFSAIPDRRRR